VNRTDRLYALVEELRAASPAWRSATSLAERFEVSSRTIERDLSALQQAGVPIYATPGRRGGYAIDTQHTLPPLNLTAAEVAAVATALAVDSSMPFTHAGRSALQKILAVLSEVDAEGTRELAARIRLFDNRAGQARPPAAVEHAIVQRRVLEIGYVDKTGEETDRVRTAGITDPTRKFTQDEMAGGSVMFAATGVTTGDYLRGVRYIRGGAVSHSVVMRSRTRTVRFIESTHRFDLKPEY